MCLWLLLMLPEWLRALQTCQQFKPQPRSLHWFFSHQNTSEVRSQNRRLFYPSGPSDPSVHSSLLCLSGNSRYRGLQRAGMGVGLMEQLVKSTNNTKVMWNWTCATTHNAAERRQANTQLFVLTVCLNFNTMLCNREAAPFTSYTTQTHTMYSEKS